MVLFSLSSWIGVQSQFIEELGWKLTPCFVLFFQLGWLDICYNVGLDDLASSIDGIEEEII